MKGVGDGLLRTVKQTRTRCFIKAHRSAVYVQKSRRFLWPQRQCAILPWAHLYAFQLLMSVNMESGLSGSVELNESMRDMPSGHSAVEAGAGSRR